MASKEDRRKVLQLYIDMIQECRHELNPDMTLSQLLVLLLVAKDGSIDQKDIYDPRSGHDIGQSSTSRAVSALSKVNRQHKPGLNVLAQYEDPLERRRKMAQLTANGEKFASRITDYTCRRIQKMCKECAQ